MTTRTSSRIHNSNDPSVQDEVNGSEFGDVQVKSVRKVKRAKQTSTTNADPEVFRRTRGKRGLLERLAKESPLDILLEVFKCMEPRDILHLARTSKDLREFLMKRSSSSIWREARENISGLPPLPIDLNEPQYASLLFDNHCYACLRSPCDNVIWESRVRCHKRCMNKLFLGYSQIFGCPHPVLSFYGFQKVIEDVPCYHGRLHGSWGRFWFTPMFDRLLSKYREVRDNESAVKKWIDEKQQDFESITSHARECRIWDASRRVERHTEQEALRDERRQEIIKRLSASGWGPKELYHCDFLSHLLFKQSKPVTERTWNNLEPQLVECLQALKDRRLKDERRRSLRLRYELFELAYDEIKGGDRLSVYPPMADLILDADLKVIDDMIWNTPQDQQLTESNFIDALHEAEVDIAEFSRKWVEQKSQELVDILRHHGLDAYDLYSVIFSCQRCGENTWAPRIYMHHCSLFYGDRKLGWNRPEFDPLHELDRGPWRAATFIPKDSLSELLKKIMTLCGKPKPERVEDLDWVDPLFECLGHRKSGHPGKRCFARWMEALLRSHDGEKVVLATCDGDTRRKILAQEQRHVIPSDVAVCKHCPPGTHPSKLNPDMRTHLRIEHDIESRDTKRNFDWCYQLRAAVFSLRLPPVTLD